MIPNRLGSQWKFRNALAHPFEIGASESAVAPVGLFFGREWASGFVLGACCLRPKQAYIYFTAGVKRVAPDWRKLVAKSKAESFKETIMSALEDETENEAIADAAKAAAGIYVERAVLAPVSGVRWTPPESEHRTARALEEGPQELVKLVEQALDGGGERFRLSFDDDSNLYLSTTGGILTATVGNELAESGRRTGARRTGTRGMRATAKAKCNCRSLAPKAGARDDNRFAMCEIARRNSRSLTPIYAKRNWVRDDERLATDL